MLRWKRNSYGGSLRKPLGLRRLCSDYGEDGSPYLEYAVHEGDGYVVCRAALWVGFVGYVYKARGTNAPFLRHVVTFGQYFGRVYI